MTNDSDTDSLHDHDDMMTITNGYYHDGFLIQLYLAWCVKKSFFPFFSLHSPLPKILSLLLYFDFHSSTAPLSVISAITTPFYCYSFLRMDLARCIFTYLPIIISFLVALDHE